MDRLRYWFSNVFGKNDNYCRGFCPKCRYYEVCRADKSLEGIRNEAGRY